MQTWEWGEIQEQLGVKIWRLVVEDNKGIQSIAFVLKRDLPFRQCWLYCPRGPIYPLDKGGERGVWETMKKKFVELAKEEKAIFVRIDPAFAIASAFAQATVEKSAGKPATKCNNIVELIKGIGFRKAEREIQPQYTLLLDLTRSEDEILAAMHSKTRYNIRLAERKGVTVRFSSDPKDVDIFLQLSREVSDRSEFHYHPDAYYQTMIGALCPYPPDKGGERGVYWVDNPSHPPLIKGGVFAELAIAEHEGDALAAHIMVYAGDTATYVHGASSTTKKNLMASHRLFWETIHRAKERGCKVYDFFGVAPEHADKRHPWAGVTRVKMGFGGRRESYIGAYDFVLELGMYSVFNTARRIKSMIG